MIYRVHHKYLVLILPLLLLSGCGLVYPDHIPFTFKSTYSTTFDSKTETYGFADVDGDGRSEFWNYAYNGSSFEQYPNSLSLYDENMVAHLWQKNSEMRYCSILPVFYRYDARTGHPQYPKGLLVASKGHFNAVLTLLEAHDRDVLWNREIYQGKDFNRNGDWDGSFELWGGEDVNGDGREDLLVRACVAFDKHLRGVWAFDITTGDTLWRYHTGCPVNALQVTDLNGDGQKEIILDTSAPGNNVAAGSTDDYHSYLVILEAATGRELYCRQTGSANSNVVSRVLERKEEGTIVATVSGANAAGTGFSRLLLWKGCPPVGVDSFDLSANLCGLHAFDANGDGKKEAVIIDGNKLKVFSPHDQAETMTLQHPPLNAVVNSLSTPINCEVLVLQNASGLMGLGTNFETLFKIEGGIQLYPLESPRLAVTTVSSLMMGSLIKTPWPVPWREIGFFGGGALLIFLVMSLVAATGMPFKWKLLNRELPCGVIWMNRRGKIKKANPQARKLLGDLAGGMREKIQAEARDFNHSKLESKELNLTAGSGLQERILHVRLRAFQRGILLLLSDETGSRRSQLLSMWAQGVQEIVHFFVKRTRIIQSKISDLRSSGLNEETLKALEVQGDLLQRYSGRFNSLFSTLKMEFQPVELNQLIRRVLVTYSGNGSGQIKFDFQVEADPLEIRAARDQIEILLHCLLDNAVAALDSHGQIRIRTSRLENLRGQGQEWIAQFAEIEIADNGPGMTPEALAASLKPGISTTGGMGLGLPQSKLITELHGGEFDIHSQPGLGTTVILKLPLGERGHESKLGK
jgi:nitrogen-specific signal transduction histidine kinase